MFHICVQAIFKPVKFSKKSNHSHYVKVNKKIECNGKNQTCSPSSFVASFFSSIMPRTRASKSNTRTSLEKLEDLSPMHHMILFDYCDGFKSNGMVGFNVVNTAGSTKHWSSKNIYKTFLTKNQFCSKGKKLLFLPRTL
jgi:hypothetical protein